MSSMPCEGLRCESPFSEFESQRIRAHLEELLGSRPFAGSRRRQAFLRYVVEETLAGQGSTIKEANIAVDVFGKGRDFDAQGGSLVRVTGGDVRKCLTQAYSLGLGQDLRIELPLGGYQPTFHFTSQPAESPEPAPGPVTIKTLSEVIPPACLDLDGSSGWNFDYRGNLGSSPGHVPHSVPLGSPVAAVPG